MSQFNDTGYGTVTLTEAVNKYQRVNAAGELCSATELGVGVALQTGAIGDTIGVAWLNKQGSYMARAAGAIAVGAVVYTAADGEVNDVQATNALQLGIALSAATADQDVIEVLAVVGDNLGA